MKNATPSGLLTGLLVTLLLVGACSEAPPARELPEQTETPLSVPLPHLNRFVLLTRGDAKFGRRFRALGGSIGVAAAPAPGLNTCAIGDDSQLAENAILLAPRVLLGERVVTGELGADQILAAKSAVTGPRSAFVAPPDVPTPGQVTPGTLSVNVKTGQTLQLAEGRFGAVTVSGTLNLSGGVYEVRSIAVKADARVIAQADTVLRVANGVSIGERGRLAVKPPLDAASLRLAVTGTSSGNDSLLLARDARLSALVVAQRNVRAADHTIISGSIAARAVNFGNDVRLSFRAGFECSASSSCDDANPCTVDVCSDARCTHAAAPDGTVCDDHDACTRSDVCQSGSCLGRDRTPCTALDQCHVAGSCDAISGVCSNPPAPDDSACDDGDPCSLGDRCVAGTCSAGTNLAVTEFATGLAQPRSLVAGSDGNLWFVAPETSPGALDGSLARMTTAGVVTRSKFLRELGALSSGPDGALWIGERLIGGLPALGRFDLTTRSFSADFSGIHAYDLATSNDEGNLIIWFTGASSVGRLAASGQLLAPVPTPNVTRAITAAASASQTVFWVTQANAGGFARIGRIAFPSLQHFVVSTPGELTDIAEGPDAGIWFTDPAQNRLGRLAASGGAPLMYPLSTPGSEPHSISAAPDGNLWVTLKAANKLVKVTPTGDMTEICIPTSNSQPTQLAVASDGNVWFVESASGKLARVQLEP